MEDLASWLPLDDPYPADLNNLGRFAEEEKKGISSAREFAIFAHRDQRRVGGQDYFRHLIATAQILIDQFDADADTVIAGILHDTVEDTHVTLEDIGKEFGEKISFLVDGVTEVGRGDGRPPVRDRAERRKLSQEKILEYGEMDHRVFLVKIADRWHNIGTSGPLRPKSQYWQAREAKDFHVPLARRLGFAGQAERMERLADAVLERNG